MGVTRMFDRIISIDWSGAGAEAERVALRIAVWERESNECRIQLPPCGGSTRSWRRSECREYLRQVLSEKARTLVGMDFGFGLPWGADQAIFQVRGWRKLIRQIGEVYAKAGTARIAAQTVNARPHLKGHGPYRFDESRTDFQFYLAHDVAYYRLTELAAPQAISQWYLGSGGTVGFHTITGLSAIDWPIGLRENGELDFAVWPFEGLRTNQSILVETYPAICPKCPDDIQCKGGDEKDAWKVLQMLVERNAQGTFANLLDIPEKHFGRVSGIDFKTQVGFEGWILGMKQD
jgi:hypothetical protein